MSDKNYYVIGDDNCRYDGMTKEEIIAAIIQAVSTGSITDIDAGFITKVKEQNKQREITFWVGTRAEYNLITEQIADCFYIITDDEVNDVVEAMAEVNKQLEVINEYNTLKEATVILNSNFAVYGSQTPTARKVGKVVTITGGLKKANSRTSIGNISGAVCGKVPSGYEPIQSVNVLCQGSGVGKFLMTIDTNGDITIARFSLGNDYYEPDTNVWLGINACYIAKN